MSALGDLDFELGDELRAFKKGNINNTPIIFESFFNCYKYLNINFDLLLYVPSNKNNNVMSFFADTISKTLNIKKSDDIILNKNIKEQKTLETLKEREDNIKNAFTIKNIENLKNKKLLIIDDVYASGATLKELIKLLKEYNLNSSIEIIVFCYRNYYL
ncbi:ComF family protein [uncultured Brachyspira sp.]|uniref:ComF family protein n=1 Tax=uncultured Brachyspira sp. TaxID=221953 RepID=UPI00345BEB80